MKELFETISNVQGGIEKNVVFCIYETISEENISQVRGLKNEIPLTAQYFSTIGYSFDINVGKEFDVLFWSSDPKNFFEVESRLEFVSFNANIQTDYLPAGQSGIVLVNFPKGKPGGLNELPEFGSEENSNEKGQLYLTTKEVMNKILENL